MGSTNCTQVKPAGANDEDRTRYLHLGKVALYQMSYIRRNIAGFQVDVYYYKQQSSFCQGKLWIFGKVPLVHQFIFSLFSALSHYDIIVKRI